MFFSGYRSTFFFRWFIVVDTCLRPPGHCRHDSTKYHELDAQIKGPGWQLAVWKYVNSSRAGSLLNLATWVLSPGLSTGHYKQSSYTQLINLWGPHKPDYVWHISCTEILSSGIVNHNVFNWYPVLRAKYYKPRGRGLTVKCHIKELVIGTNYCNRITAPGCRDVSF